MSCFRANWTVQECSEGRHNATAGIQNISAKVVVAESDINVSSKKLYDKQTCKYMVKLY